MFEKLASLVEAIAYTGTGAASILLTYQPKTPACLVDDED